ncbi:sugar transferase [Oleiphilus sp. HI0133]|nr:sugar transferase [Oleiphilus sp. HI0133]
MSLTDALIKRCFDVVVALVGLSFSFWLILLAWIAASIDTCSNGFFIQQRVGRNGRLFKVVKIKTMRQVRGIETTITADNDPRITKLGAFFRKTKIDELPQLWNVLLGQMSFVGPRPDVPGYADKLVGEERLVLTIRPGITGPATLKYKNEEALLAAQADPAKYNDEVIFPDKVKINMGYIKNYSFLKDLNYISQTLFVRGCNHDA